MSAKRLKALNSLKRLQLLEADRVKARFALCLQEEETIENGIKALNDDISTNKAFAFERNDDEQRQLDLQNSYREWLPLARRQIDEKQEALWDAQRRTEMARAEMVTVNTALEATEKLIEEVLQFLELERQRKEQLEIDDMARTTFIRRRSGKEPF